MKLIDRHLCRNLKKGILKLWNNKIHLGVTRSAWLGLVSFSILLLFFFSISSTSLAAADIESVMRGSSGGSIGVFIPPLPEKPPLGPPLPSPNAKGSLSIKEIHHRLHDIYEDCIEETNAAFQGQTPEKGREFTHDHLEKCDDCKLESRSDWRCGDPPDWVGKEYCERVDRVYDKYCRVMPTDEKGFFQCEIEHEWYVKMFNEFHYRLEFPYEIHRDLFQTAEIRVYCDGWNTNTNFGGGTIKIVQLPAGVSTGLSSHWENILPTAHAKVVKGLSDQYFGHVNKMRHIINVKGISGSRCSSLGIDGDESMPMEERNIIWDIPPSMDVNANQN